MKVRFREVREALQSVAKDANLTSAQRDRVKQGIKQISYWEQSFEGVDEGYQKIPGNGKASKLGFVELNKKIAGALSRDDQRAYSQ